MKIALLTYHRSYNYGAMLQAVATRIALQQLGHDVYYINYWPEHQRVLYRDQPIIKAIKYYLKYAPLRILAIPHKLLWQSIRRYKYKKFIKKYIAPFYGVNDWEYDVLVCGSDQIWRKQPVTGKYNPYYFGDNDIKAPIKLSYASSMGTIPQSAEDKIVVSELLKNLDFISVREIDLRDYIQKCIRRSAVQVLDPTLLLTAKQWRQCLSFEKKQMLTKYLLVYDLGQKFKKDEISKFAEKNHLSVVETIPWCELHEQQLKPAIDDPLDFIRLIDNASFVLTSSFHGMAFSIVFGKPFYVTSSSNTNRFISLLESLNLQERWLEDTDVSKLKCLPLDYNPVKRKLGELTDYSISYLKEHIKSDLKNGK